LPQKRGFFLPIPDNRSFFFVKPGVPYRGGGVVGGGARGGMVFSPRCGQVFGGVGHRPPSGKGQKKPAEGGEPGGFWNKKKTGAFNPGGFFSVDVDGVGGGGERGGEGGGRGPGGGIANGARGNFFRVVHRGPQRGFISSRGQGGGDAKRPGQTQKRVICVFLFPGVKRPASLGGRGWGGGGDLFLPFGRGGGVVGCRVLCQGLTTRGRFFVLNFFPEFFLFLKPGPKAGGAH